MPEMSWLELRDHTDDVLRRVEAGESFTITRDGVPVAELVPFVATGSNARSTA